MEHLNYCRQIRKQFAGYDFIAPKWAMKYDDRTIVGYARQSSQKLESAVKFIMPNGGRVLDDRRLRALDPNEKLHLPYPLIALEYPCNPSHNVRDDVGEVISRKRVVMAEEHEDVIVLTTFIYLDKIRMWSILPQCAVPRVGFFDPELSNDNETSFRLKLTDESVPGSDYADEVLALLMLLNALQCSNVGIGHSPARHAGKGKNCNSAFPFDSYKLLMVDVPKKPGLVTGRHITSRASPREHLRRGHIRRLEDGRKFWINAAVVAAGNGGKIHKDYGIRRAA